MKYYHNPRCAKSREGLALLTENGHTPEIIEYLKEPLTPGQLESIIDKLDCTAADLIRESERVWKEEFKGKELSEDELVLAMIEHPKLMQRPILETEAKAALGRPPENLLAIL